MDYDQHRTTIAIASLNTRVSTDLTLRALQHHTSVRDFRVVVGDCGSTDGSLNLLINALKQGRIDDLELAPHGRRHAAWIDHWISNCTTPELLILDSDLEIRRSGWLDGMRDKLASRVFVAAEQYPAQPDYVDARDGTPRFLQSRPGVHLMLIDVSLARTLGTSFEETFKFDETLGRERGWDVGGAFMNAASVAGLDYAFMPEDFQSSYRHWIGMSWQSGLSGQRARLIANRAKMRARHAAYSLPRPLASAALRKLERSSAPSS